MASSLSVFQRATVTVEEAAKILGLSRGSAYLAARRGQIPTIRVGSRLIVPVRALEKLLESAGGEQTDDDDGS